MTSTPPLDLDAIQARATDVQQYGIEDDGFEQLVREDVPALVAEVRRLRAELAAAQKQAIPWAADRLGRLIAIHREAALKVDDPADRASIAKFADGADWASGLLRQWAGEQHASDGEASR
ncbi:hypothetical protein CFC35_05590 [Streptomyces sp. FBKL.4005]|uniref:hypothetical protein n=1 Tax=Streptomyces sp. FBKL.4005 TaxID=2015515 RepID=UPI000B975A34|nr:hypothetical protein [Streptomyces sp. FBKL.4005]OYP14038.1 hypothetical protein CFC35_05590 [Streptomyces sp. FBKL.4005]